MAVYVIRPSGRDWTFRLVNRRGDTLLKGGLHSSAGFAAAAITEVRARAGEAASYQRSLTPAGRYSYMLLAADGRKLAASNFYSSERAMQSMLEACRAEAPGAAVRTEAEAIEDAGL